MNPIVKFFHEMFNPHCEHCIEQNLMNEESERLLKICPSCETTKMELAYANQRIDKLLDKLVKEDEPQQVSEQIPPRILQTNRQHVPFSVIRNRLETESRIKAEQMRAEKVAESKAAKPDVEKIEKLETELGINDAGNKSA